MSSDINGYSLQRLVAKVKYVVAIGLFAMMWGTIDICISYKLLHEIYLLVLFYVIQDIQEGETWLRDWK